MKYTTRNVQKAVKITLNFTGQMWNTIYLVRLKKGIDMMMHAIISI